MVTFRVAGAALALVLAVLAVAIGAANVVPSSHTGARSTAITAQALAPPQCAGLGLTQVVAGTNGTAANDLVLGTAAGETLKGKGGVDCIVGGGGNDSLNGNGATGDVCIGGPGIDTFKKCETQYQ